MVLLLHSSRVNASWILVPVFTNYQTRMTGVDSSDHRHPVYHLIFITEGEGRFRGDASGDLKAGDWVVIDPMRPHRFSAKGMLRYYAFTFCLLDARIFQERFEGKPEALFNEAPGWEDLAERRSLSDLFALPSGVIRRPKGDVWARMMDRLARYHQAIEPLVAHIPIADYRGAWRDRQAWREYLRQSVVAATEWLSEASSETPEPIRREDGLSRRIMDFVQGHVHERYDLKALASALGMTPQHVCAWFKSRNGRTVGAYVSEAKVRRAADYLRETDKPVTEIASILSFSSSQHLATAFRKSMGMSPREWRRRMG